MSHDYRAVVQWQGADLQRSFTYVLYSRNYRVRVPGKPELEGSADPAFRGDPARHNPEDFFVAAISACHMLTYLAICARHGIHVIAYEDDVRGRMEADPAPGRFVDVLLRPQVTLAVGDRELAERLHTQAHRNCFIANSCRVPIRCEPSILEVGR